MSFSTASAITELSKHRYQGLVPDGWQQGRGAFGGLSIGLIIRAMEASRTKARSLRALTAELPGPVLPGPVTIEVTELREGKNVTVLEGHLRQEDRVLARASGVFGEPRSDARNFQPTFAKPAEDFTTIEPLPLAEGGGPRFSQFFEHRVAGPMPMGASQVANQTAKFEGWINFKTPPSTLGAPEIAALADAYWPSTFSVEPGPTPIATVSYTLQLTKEAASLDPKIPLLHSAETLAMGEGYAIEQRALWTHDGRLVALNPQTLVII